MTTPNEEHAALEFVHETANDRFKRRAADWFWGAVAVAAVVHFGIFAFWPQLHAEDISYSPEELEAIDLPPEVEIPPPPEQIARPATPVVAEAAEVDENITMERTTFEDNPIDELPPPPSSGEGDLAAAPAFTPYTVAPELKNTDEVMRALQRAYPPLLRDAGIGGNVLVWFFIDEQGRVQNSQIKESSGHDALDQAAVEVAEVYQFTPALNRDKRVPVWIALPIVFQTR